MQFTFDIVKKKKEEEVISRGVFTPKYLNLAALVHGFKFMTSSQLSGSCFFRILNLDEWVLRWPLRPLLPSSTNILESNFQFFCFHFYSLGVDLYTLQPTLQVLTDFPSKKLGKPNGKRHQPTVVCDLDAFRGVNHERINPDEGVHGEYLAFQRNEGQAHVNHGFILCGL